MGHVMNESLLRELGLMPKDQGPRSETHAPTPSPPEPVAWKPSYPGEDPPF